MSLKEKRASTYLEEIRGYLAKLNKEEGPRMGGGAYNPTSAFIDAVRGALYDWVKEKQNRLRAVYAGSFDPVTLGHEDILRRAANMFDDVIVGVGVNNRKTPFFTTEERIDMARAVSDDLPNVQVQAFEGLLVNFCLHVGATVIVRGLRIVSDFESELMLAHTNNDLSPKVETVWLPTHPTQNFISSSMVREIAINGGRVDRYVRGYVAERIQKKLSQSPSKMV